jgi:hypothetical protein
MSDLRQATESLLAALQRNKIPYAFGGSFASSVYGIARQTQDLDIVVALTLSDVPALHADLRPDFYIDEEDIRDALRRGRSFNAIHLATAFKFDFFVASRHPLGETELDRSSSHATDLLGGAPLTLRVVSPEDIILAKLLWYRDGGHSSSRQWNDLRNVMTMQFRNLDFSYLHEQASRLDILPLLVRLRDEVAPSPVTQGE